MLNGSFRTNGFHGYSVKFSPFQPQKVACVTSKNYGISGPGCLFILNEDIQVIGLYHWHHGLYDLTWSELDDSIIVSCSADGTIQIWDLKLHNADPNSHVHKPIQVLAGHSKEVYSIDWSQIRSQQLLVSGSWDCSAKVWDPHTKTLLVTFTGHNHLVYAVAWSNHIPHCFASVSGDGNLRIWDTNAQDRPRITVPAHSSEVLCCDWNKYCPDMLVTGGVDGLIKGWDLRMPVKPIFQLAGHNYAVRRVKCSPHNQFIVASTSYDMTTKLWNWQESVGHSINLNKHTEFVYGLDFNLHSEGQLADCGWDEIITICQTPTFSGVMVPVP